jgi:protein O-mannosyl-transferase
MSAGSSSGRANSRQAWLICAGLAALTLTVYWRVGGATFVDYDDPFIFFNNAFVRGGLAWNSIVWGATTCYYEYWHPLMWWSHMLDCQLFGLNAGAHHLVNLGFHVANTLLVFVIFRRMTGMVWRSAMVAALFGLHPIHVESVAWLAERKDLLSTFFALASIWAYAEYVRERDLTGSKPKAVDAGVGPPKPLKKAPQRPEGGGGSRFYRLALVLFLLGLLSKPMVVTLPFVLVLLDYWPLNRISDLKFRVSDPGNSGGKGTLGGAVREKWPFFGLSALFCFITWYSVKAGNNFPNVKPVTRYVHWANIPVAYVRYLWKTIYPRNLAVFYPMPDSIPWWEVAGALCLLGLITLAVVRARTAKYLLFGWCLFFGGVFPTIGVVQVGAQALADRYMYLPALGLFVAAVWGVGDTARGWPGRKIVLGIFGAVVVAVCSLLTRVQVGYWRNTISLWEHCLAAGYESVIAYHDLGRAYLDAGEPAKGLENYQAALKIDPDDPRGNLGYGAALLEAGRQAEATNYLGKVLRADPNDATAHGDMGLALIELKKYDEAIGQISEQIRLQPGLPAAYANLGKAYSAQGNSDEAVNCYLTALKLNPNYAAGHYYLGKEYLKRGAVDDAISHLKQAAECDPSTITFHLDLAAVYSSQQDAARAIAEYRAALRLNPDALEALNNLAWILATTSDARLRNGAEAVKLGLHACEVTSWQQTLLIGTLAAAYAEAGDFDKAVETAQKACDLASAHGEKELLQANQNLMAQYKEKQPFHERGTNTN